MRILIWATTFGADLWSLAKYLDARDDVTLKIVMNDPALFEKEGISKLYPLRSPIIRRRRLHDVVGVPFFRPHITIMDNRVPFRATSPKGFVLWHGFGWKGPNDVEEFKYLHMTLKRAWGATMRPNPNFRWQCFGPWDFEHRTKTSGFHPDNCRIIGSCNHDDLLQPVEKERLQPFYPFDLKERKTVLIAPTWHYGGVFSHWGDEEILFDRLLAEIHARGANAILRLHDSFRFPKSYRKLVEFFRRKYPRLLIKYKDQNPDNTLDLQAADVLITNFSSIANLFYATRKPTIHVYPVKSADESFMWRRYTPLGVVGKKIDSVRYIWKLDPEDNGGLLARDFNQLMEQVGQALDAPDCCRATADEFLNRHMLGADGKSCERAYRALSELMEDS